MMESEEIDSELLLNDGIIDVYYPKNELYDSEKRKEFIRYSEVCCKKDFTYFERLNGRDINLLQGLELHTDVFNFTEQNEIVECIYRLQRMGQEGRLRDKTYSKPRKWMRDLKAIRPGEFSGPASISLPVGSVFVLKGNGADIAKHCVPSVSSKRISITFRKMDERKLPYYFSPDPELMGIKPLINSPPNKLQRNSETQIEKDENFEFDYNPVWWKTRKESFRVEKEYPPPINGSFRRSKGNEFRHGARY
ncbi:hypothetical protein TSUD_390470 [Trifolium subterraneum]|uniref:Fe2OG dioxygenase domain-containing protein n=1 Tax=Trifolium subterraneum TaxID=3900 RepID=A0A2Z6NWY1_TRISU|nr:hypothetical protein TSUD_390470 [Trifolium subterraneum]